MVPQSRLAPSAARMPPSACVGVRAARLDGAEAQHDCRDHNCQRAQQHLCDILRARASQFAEQQPAPENADQRIGVPQGKRNRQADVANGKHGKRIGHGPHIPAIMALGNEMTVCA